MNICPIINPCSVNLDTLRYTPILLKWDSVTLPLYDDPPIIPYKKVLLSPRYYIKIFHPNNFNTDQSFSPNPFIYKIDKYGILANTLQLLLRPSIDQCRDSLYRVEYWYWRKLVYIQDINTPVYDNDVNITHKFIKEEYWYIPNSNLQIGTLSLKRRDDDDILPNMDVIPSPYDLEVFAIKDVINEEDYEDWTLKYNTLDSYIGQLTNERIVSSTSINWLKGPRLNTSYKVLYYKPLGFKEILVINDRFGDMIHYPLHGEALPPQYTSTYY